MGLNISGLIDSDVKMNVTAVNFMGKTIAIDAFNVIYQFLSVIRDNRGKPLRNMDGDITSHLSGLFYRTLNLLEHRIKPIYIFDGLDKCKKIRHSYNIDKTNFVPINNSIIDSSKKLLEYMGISCIQAPSEGESQCVQLCKDGKAWATASQDYDVLIFGGERLVRNLAVGSKLKKGNIYIEKNIEYIRLDKFLDKYNITQEQLIDLSILIGNDYFCGIKGVGASTAIKLFNEYKDIDNIKFNSTSLTDDNKIILKDKSVIPYDDLYDIMEKYRDIFINPVVDKNYKLTRNSIDYEELLHYLVYIHGFSLQRVENAIKRMKGMNIKYNQKNLMDF